MITETAGIRLVVAPMAEAQGFQYRLLGAALAGRGEVALASGIRDQLRDAMDAAERAAQTFAGAAAA